MAGLPVASGVPFRIGNPLRARQFANSIGLLGKNDTIDALARFRKWLAPLLRFRVQAKQTKNAQGKGQLIAKTL